MLLFKRPKQPRGFAKDVGPARRAVKAAVAASKKLDQIPEVWREEKYKRAFAAAQHDKCGYCETFALNHPAPMDHHAPARELQVLAREGFEVDGHYHVRDRETPQVSATGYHWLAFAWSNWVLTCERCNTGWKRGLFPVLEDMRSGFTQAPEGAWRLGGIEGAKAFVGVNAPRPPHPRRRFTPLLLNPFGPEDPVDHLEFSEHGQIAPRDGSDRGRETIRTCGLHRESLRKVRSSLAKLVHGEVTWLLQTLRAGDHGAAWKSTKLLLSLGAESSAHAGMVRSIVLSQLARRWPELEILEKKLRPAVVHEKRKHARR